MGVVQRKLTKTFKAFFDDADADTMDYDMTEV